MTSHNTMMIVILISAMWITTGLSGPSYAEKSTDTDEIVAGNTAFAVDIYHNLRESDNNLFFSPLSISTALAMTWAGARGNTEEQMAEALHFTLTQQRLHPTLSGLQTELNVVTEKGGVELTVANALWAQKGLPFLPAFFDLMREAYLSTIHFGDFARATETVRREINEWVEQETREKIKDLMKPRACSRRKPGSSFPVLDS